MSENQSSGHPREDFPGLLQGTALGFASMVFGAILLVIVRTKFRGGSGPGEQVPLFLLHGVLSAIMMVAITAFHTRLPLRELVPLRRASPGLVLGVVITIVGGIVVLSEVVALLALVLPIPDSMMEMMKGLLSATPTLWSQLLLIAVLPGFFEEVVCRGILLRGFLRRYSPLRAILYSSGVFAAGHFNPWQAVTAFALGAYFGWLYYRTRSILPGVLGHMLNNGIYVALSFLPASTIPGLTGQDSEQPALLPIWLVIAALAVVALGFRLTKRALLRT